MKKYLVNKLVEANLVKIISETKIQKTYHSVQKITPATTDDIHFLSNFAISLKFEAHETGQ